MADSPNDPPWSDSTSPTKTSSRRARFEVAGFTELSGVGGSSTRSNSPEPLSTPTLGESYNGLKKSLSFKSLRELEMKEVQGALWRKGQPGNPGEPRHRPASNEEVFAHAVRGGARELYGHLAKLREAERSYSAQQAPSCSPPGSELV